MNTLLRILVLVMTTLSYVWCSWNSDATEVQSRIAQLNKLNESELFNYIDSTLATAGAMAENRGKLAAQKGLECYAYLYSKYLPSFTQFVETYKTKIREESDPNKRMELLKELAGLATNVKWDEEYRAVKRPNYPLEEKTTQCLPLSKLKFNGLITSLTTGLNLISIKESLDKHEPTSTFYKSMANLFGKIYREAVNYPKTHKQNDLSERKCLTALNNEMKRFLYLATLKNKAVLSN